MSLAGTETVMDAQQQNGDTGAKDGLLESVSSPEPVYRFYLSPPPAATMQPGMASMFAQMAPQQQAAQQQPQQQVPPQQQTMFPSPMGMMAYNPYMPMSPAPMGGVSAFGGPGGFYAAAPAQQTPMFYPSAFGMPAAAAIGGMQHVPRAAGMAGSSAPSSVAASQTPSEKGEADMLRAKTPIVNEAGVPMGGFGVDQDGQYIEIKFPTFGQVQMQHMLQQLHIGQQQQQQQQQQLQQPVVAVAKVASNVVHQPVAKAPVPAQVATPVSSAVAPETTLAAAPAAHGAGSKALDVAPQPTAGISIYEAETFAGLHMEDIVFDNKAFFWKIDNWDKLERRATSDMFRCGGHMWRILLRPFGSSHKGVLSLFLECLGTADSSDDWRCTCRFVLAVANPDDPTHNTHGAAYHCFHRNNPNWGFTRFMKLADLRTASAPGVRPYIQDGACTIAAYLHVIKEPSQ